MTHQLEERDGWLDFHDQYLDNPLWFDEYDRPKTYRAVKELAGRMSDQDLEKFKERASMVFAPGAVSGMAIPMHIFTTQANKFFVYLPYLLEKRSQRRITSTVAHEFAHVLLGHVSQGKPLEDLYNQEREADSKIMSWGIEPAYREEDYPCISSTTAMSK